MTAALTVKHDIAAPAYEVVPAAMVAHVEEVIALAAPIVIVDAASADAANKVMLQLHNVSKEVANHGDKVKRPLNAIIKAVRDCLERAEGPLLAEKRKLQEKIAAWDREQRRLREEAQAAAAEELRVAQAKAAAETKRLQDEANARAAEANRLAQERAKEAEELIGGPVVAEVVKAEVVAPVKVAAPTTVVPVAAESSVVIKQMPRIECFDPRALAAAYEVGGLILVEPNMALVKQLMDAGIAVPGCRRIMVEQVAARGVRS